MAEIGPGASIKMMKSVSPVSPLYVSSPRYPVLAGTRLALRRRTMKRRIGTNLVHSVGWEAGLFQPEIPEEHPTPMFWFSSDSKTWTVVDMVENFGTDHTPTDILVGGESVLIRWSGIELSDDGEGFSEDHDDPPDLIWVGTRVDSR